MIIVLTYGKIIAEKADRSKNQLMFVRLSGWIAAALLLYFFENSKEATIGADASG
ncbi:hypothetical protein D3C74_198700 [compost metagenome]